MQYPFGGPLLHSSYPFLSSCQEEGHVLPRPSIAMERNRVNGISPLESTASDGSSPVELWNGVSQIVRHHAGLCNAGSATGVSGGKPSAAFTGMVLCRQGQTGFQTSRVGGEHVLCALIALALELVAQRRTPASIGFGCEYLEEAFHRVMYQRGLSWLCDPGGMENRGRRRKRGLAAHLACFTLAFARKRANELDGFGAH
jgi:hypothetical protein